MPSKKKKYNSRFPPARIKKIMQKDEEVGKVAQAVPVIISRALELFVESLLEKAMKVTTSRNAKTLSPSHLKQCIVSEARFDFLRDLVKGVPDIQCESNENNTSSSAAMPTDLLSALVRVPRRASQPSSIPEEPSPNNSLDSGIASKEEVTPSGSFEAGAVAIKEEEEASNGESSKGLELLVLPHIRHAAAATATSTSQPSTSNAVLPSGSPVVMPNFYQEIGTATCPSEDIKYQPVPLLPEKYEAP